MRPPRTSATDIAVMLGSGLSNQVGAAIGALAFPVVGATGVVAVRQWVAGAVLLAVGRPRATVLAPGYRLPIAALAVVFATMNLSLYTAIDRIGLGLAVTLEFLGPLGVALAASRRRADLVATGLACAGVVVLTRPKPTTDYVGIGLALLAAACWAAYILLNRALGARVPGAQATAVAASASAVAFVPVGVVVLVANPPTPAALACAAAAGVLSSAVPFLADLTTLRRVPPAVFGVFMSANPVLAALVGLVVLDQAMDLPQWLGIVAIAAANCLTVVARRP